MKGFFVIAALTFIALVEAQRSPYAGRRPIGSPQLADRFRDDADTVTSTTESLVNRVGEDGQVITTTTARLPVDALGDRELVDRISRWPVDKQPYWYLNRQHIEAQRQRPQIPQDNVESRSSFAGKLNNRW